MNWAMTEGKRRLDQVKSKSEKTRADQPASSLAERMGREQPQAAELCVHTLHWNLNTQHCINLNLNTIHCTLKTLH